MEEVLDWLATNGPTHAVRLIGALLVFWIMPNSEVTAGAITNLSATGSLRVDLVAGIAYDADLRAAKTILQSILDEHPKVLAEPAPSVNVLELADSSVNLAVRPNATVAD